MLISCPTLCRNLLMAALVRDERARIHEISWYLQEKGSCMQVKKIGAMSDLEKVIKSLSAGLNPHATPWSMSSCLFAAIPLCG